MNRRWNTVRDLGWLEWQVLLRSVILLPACARRLRVRGVRHAIDREQRIPCQAPGQPPEVRRDLALRIARAVELAAYHGPFTVNCLPRSLVLTRLLRKRGLECELKLGAAVGESFGAHAWVEYEGQPLNDDPEVIRRFAEFRPETDRHR